MQNALTAHVGALCGRGSPFGAKTLGLSALCAQLRLRLTWELCVGMGHHLVPKSIWTAADSLPAHPVLLSPCSESSVCWAKGQRVLSASPAVCALPPFTPGAPMSPNHPHASARHGPRVLPFPLSVCLLPAVTCARANDDDGHDETTMTWEFALETAAGRVRRRGYRLCGAEPG